MSSVIFCAMHFVQKYVYTELFFRFISNKCWTISLNQSTLRFSQIIFKYDFGKPRQVRRALAAHRRLRCLSYWYKNIFPNWSASVAKRCHVKWCYVVLKIYWRDRISCMGIVGTSLFLGVQMILWFWERCFYK